MNCSTQTQPPAREDLTDRHLDAVLRACGVLAAQDDEFLRRQSATTATELVRARHFLKRQSNVDEIKAFARKRIGKTSVQTVPEIMHAKSWEIRVAWAILLIVAMIGCIYQIYEVIDDFYESPTSTKVEFIRPAELEYPTLSICAQLERNLDERVAKPDLLSGKLTRNYINAVEWGLGIVRSSDWRWIEYKNDSEIDAAYAQAIEEHGSIINARLDLQRRYGLTCWTFFRACYDHLNNYFNCCQAFEPNYFMQGICFSTKPGHLKAFGEGNSEAVRFLVWNFPQIDVITGDDGEKTIEREFQTYIAGLMPNTRLDQTPQFPNLVYLKAGDTVLYHITNKRVIRRKESVSGPCFKEGRLNVFQNFTVNNCDWERVFFERLNISCQLPITGLLSGNDTVENPCDWATRSPETIRNLYGLGEGQEFCSYWCLFRKQWTRTNCSRQLCDLERFSHTATRLPADWTDTRTDMEVQIQFEALEIEQITEVPRLGFSDAVGVIGGIFGLWVGASIISLVHVIVICCSIAGEACKAKILRKVRPEASLAEIIKKNVPALTHKRPSTTSTTQVLSKLVHQRSTSV